MSTRKFKLGDIVVSSRFTGDYRAGKIVELSTFKPDGKGPLDFKAGLYGSYTYGVIFQNSKSATYHFEENLKHRSVC